MKVKRKAFTIGRECFKAGHIKELLAGCKISDIKPEDVVTIDVIITGIETKPESEGRNE